MRKTKIKNGNVDPANVYVVNLAFLKLKLSGFFSFLTNVFTMMTDNINYPSPSPDIASIKSLVDLYHAAKANNQTKQANVYLKQIKTLMKALTMYVANNCGNNLVKLKSSGFRANKKGGGFKRMMTKVKNVKLKDNGFSGQFVASYDKMPGAKLYLGYVKISNVTDAEYGLASASHNQSITFQTYNPGTILDVCIAAKGASGEGPKSAKMTIVVR